ncbi:MAG TPA: hypothetical protein VNO14_19890 [Blastocatellia bacterium]|nr:hypothetical protein [Blastocatellia bacterium]
MKSGGTSINFAFLRGLCDPSVEVPAVCETPLGTVHGDAVRPWELYISLTRNPSYELTVQGRRVVGHRPCRAPDERFYYWFSHQPTPRSALPADAYAFTCLRNPLTRLLSYFSEIRAFCELGTLSLWGMERYQDVPVGEWIGRTPPQELCHQVYLFSETGNVDEAIDRISRLDRIVFTEALDDGFAILSRDTGIPLPRYRIRSNNPRIPATLLGEERLLEAVEKEFQLLEALGRRIEIPRATLDRRAVVA